MTNLEKYKQALKAHDWYYAFADGYNEYDKGKEQRNKLHEMARDLDPDFNIWNEAAPDQFKVKKK
jgi:hypothetical protein